MLAVVQGHATVVKLLLQAGANPDLKDKVRLLRPLDYSQKPFQCLQAYLLYFRVCKRSHVLDQNVMRQVTLKQLCQLDVSV